MLTGGLTAIIIGFGLVLAWAIMHILDLKSQLKDEAVMRGHLVDELNALQAARRQFVDHAAPTDNVTLPDDEPIAPTTENVETLKSTAQIMKEATVDRLSNEQRNWDDV